MSIAINVPSPFAWVGPYVEAAIRPVHVVLGVWGLAYDGVYGILRDPTMALEAIERRGIRVEQDFQLRLNRLENRGNFEINRFSKGARHPLQWVQSGISETSHFAEDELERQVERVLQSMGIPTRERLDRLSKEIENLSHKIDQELLLLAEEANVNA